MTTHFGFKGQKDLPSITKEDLEAFNAERFKFANEVSVGRSTFEVLRDASLKLLETAMGERRQDLPAISDEVLKRYTGTSRHRYTGTQDESIW